MTGPLDLDRGLRLLGLDERLVDAPPNAHTRGLFFRLPEQALGERSKDLVAVWRTLTGARSRWFFKLYPVRDFLRELAFAAVLLEPDNPHAALRHMWSTTPRLSPVIRADGFMRHLAGNDPGKALTWLASNRRMMCDYGAWRLELPGTRRAVLHFEDEFVWLESCHVGGSEGTLRRCGVVPAVTAELDSPYSGRLVMSWT